MAIKAVDKFIKEQKKKEQVKKNIKERKKRTREERKEALKNQEFLTCRSIFGNQWANWFCLCGGRQAGKTYSVQKEVLNCFFKQDHPLYHVPFVWMRLNDIACRNMTQNNCANMFEPDLVRMFKLHDFNFTGSKLVCESDLEPGHKLHLCDIYGLSTAYNNKGAALFDSKNFKGKHIVMDEIAYEKNQKKTFDVAYGVSLQIENLTRNKRHRVKVIMMLNQTQDCPDVIATIFGFIPLEFGVYKLARHKKDILRLDELMDSPNEKIRKAAEKEYEELAIQEKGKYFGVRGVIYNMPVTDKANKRNAVRLSKQADPNGENFTNTVERDLTLLNKDRLYKPLYVIKFSQYAEDWYTVWLNMHKQEVIVKYRNEKPSIIRAMAPNCGDAQSYSSVSKQYVIDLFNQRYYLYKDYKTMKLFQHHMFDVPGMKSK